MAFEATRFSENGLQLLAQLTTSKTLKVKYVYVDSVEHSIEDLEQPPSWWASETAATMALVEPEIILAGAKDTQARIRVKLSLKSDTTETQTIKTVVLCACTVESESGTEGETVTFCGVMDSEGVEVLYHSGTSIKTSTAVSLYFKLSNETEISIETMENPDFVTVSDLDRYMTCHNVLSAYEGEAQEVYGAKYFTNIIADVYNGLKFGENTDDTYFNITCEDWFMAFDAFIDVGTYDQTIYCFRNNNFDIIKVDLDSNGVYNTSFSGQINSGSVYTNEIGSDNTYIRLGGDLIPKDGGNGYSLGSENNYFNNSFCYTYNGETFKSRITTDTNIVETTLAEGLSFSQYVGSAQNWHATIKYNNVTGPNAALVTSVKDIDCIVVNENYATFNTDIIAKKSIKFDNNIMLYEDDRGLTINPGEEGMYVQGDLSVQGKISGKLPTTDIDPTPRIPVGAVVCLNDLPTDQGVGRVVQGTYTLCGLTGVTDPQGHTTKADEEYQLLTSTSTNVTYALAMRIS